MDKTVPSVVLKKTCLNCGREFEKPPTTSRKEFVETRKYCSSKCRDTNPSKYAHLKKYEYPKGQKPWNMGKTPSLQQHNNPNWKGSAAGYSAIHKWLETYATKCNICAGCGKLGLTQWANISGEYRRALDDFRELCPKCHVWGDKLAKMRRHFEENQHLLETLGTRHCQEIAIA